LFSERSIEKVILYVWSPISILFLVLAFFAYMAALIITPVCLQKGKSETLFAPPVVKEFKEGREGGRFYKNRFVNSYSQHVTRTGSGYVNSR